MKQMMILLAFCLLLVCFGGCANDEPAAIAATTLPVFEFTSRLCQGTDITVTQLITENVSCLHDYTLQVRQMQAVESAHAVVISGAGLEEFLEDVLLGAEHVIDASNGIDLIRSNHDHAADDGHRHEDDPHIWLSPEIAMQMCQNICRNLTVLYPQHEPIFTGNLQTLLQDLEDLQQYGLNQLAHLSCKDLITFHDGFSYFAEAFHLHILKTVEEESGSEASAQELIELIRLVQEHRLPAVFTETNGSTSAARTIAAETDASIYSLDMAMSGSSYFQAMYYNIDTIKEALG